MECPLCQGPMWNNIGRKKNPKQPDYRCKDPECQGVIWPPRTPKVDSRAVSEPNKAISTPTVNPILRKDEAFRSMILSFCKDIVVAEIAKGEVKAPFARIADGYKVLLKAYHHPFGEEVQPNTFAAEIDLNQEAPF